MKIYVSADVISAINELIAMAFDYNAMVDNCSYALQATMGYNNVGDVVHENWAHWYTSDELADKCSNILIRNNARPVRRDIKGYTKDYNSVLEVFEDIVDSLDTLRTKTLEVIDLCDYDINDKPVGIEMEDVLLNIVNKLRATNTLVETIKRYEENNNTYKLEKDIYSLMGICRNGFVDDED